MAAGAVFNSLWWIVEAVDTVAGHAALQEAVIVVLCPQPLVVIDFIGKVRLVTAGAEFRRPVHGFEQGLLVVSGLGLDQLMIDRFQ